MKMRRWPLLAAFLLAAPIVTAQEVTTDYDHHFDFSTIKTFAVQVATPSGNPLAEDRVVADVEEALSAKGWTKTDPERADAMVLLHGASEERSELQTFYTGGGGWRWRGVGMGSVTTTETRFTVGTLVVDIYETSAKSLVFRGTASDELSKKAEKNQKKVEKAVARMFKDFPPSPKTQ